MLSVERTQLENSIFSRGIDNFFSGKEATNLQDLKTHLYEIFHTNKWDLSKYEKAVYNDKHPEFTSRFKLRAHFYGKIAILSHLFRKAVFKKPYRYHSFADESIKIYITHDSAEKFNQAIEETQLLGGEKFLAKEFMFNFPSFGKSLGSHLKMKTFEPKQFEIDYPQIQNEENQIIKTVESHLFPFIAGYQKDPTAKPLFVTLKILFKVDRAQLLEIALKAYCRCAFRGLYICKFNQNKPDAPNQNFFGHVIKIMNNKADLHTNADLETYKRWFKTWARSTPPNFTIEFYIYLKALALAIEMDFGFAAPYPLELVKIAKAAGQHVNNLRMYEQNQIAEMNQFFWNHTNFTIKFREKLSAVFDEGVNIDTPYNPSALSPLQEKHLEWFKKIYKHPPSFNIAVLITFQATLIEIKHEGGLVCFKSEEFLEKIKNCIFKVMCEKKIERNYIEEQFETLLSHEVKFIDNVFMDTQTYEKCDQHKILEKWYEKWSGKDYPAYTTQILSLLKKFSLLTKPLPDVFLTPKELEEKVVEEAMKTILTKKIDNKEDNKILNNTAWMSEII